MKLKQAVISAILALKNAEGADQAKAVCLQLLGSVPASEADMLQALGKALRANSIPDTAFVAPKAAEEHTHPEATTEGYTMPIAAQLSLQQHDLVQSRVYYHRQLIAATSDADRAKILRELRTVQARIKDTRELLNKADKGETVDLPQAAPDPTEQYAVIPTELHEIIEKIKLLSALRSKRKKTMDTQPENSPKWQKAAKDWAVLDRCIQKLRDVKEQKLRAKGGHESA